MRVIVDPAEMQVLSRQWRGREVGFVPTMGFLHRGHVSLMELACARAEAVVASIYVNPLQFGPTEDLGRYPRDPAGDLEKCESAGVDFVFMPENLYPADFCTEVQLAGPSAGYEGAARPGHFSGVATVVARLFGLVQPSFAVFGEKDWQQLAVVSRMVADLAMAVEIVPGPLIRDHDGLALSSRNVYLSPEERLRATSIHRALCAVRDSAEVEVERLEAIGRAHLDVDRLDYLSVVDPGTLRPLTRVEGEARVLVAAKVGAPRLLDNMAIRRG